MDDKQFKQLIRVLRSIAFVGGIIAINLFLIFFILRSWLPEIARALGSFA